VGPERAADTTRAVMTALERVQRADIYPTGQVSACWLISSVPMGWPSARERHALEPAVAAAQLEASERLIPAR
jgi:hypothetical protein